MGDQGWVQVQHKKPQQKPQQKPPPQQQRNQTQANGGGASNHAGSRTVSQKVPIQVPIHVPTCQTKHPNEKNLLIHIKAPATPLNSPPKSILAYGESNHFDLDDTLVKLSTETKGAKLVKQKHKQPNTKAHPDGLKAIIPEQETVLEFEEEPITNFFGWFPPEVTLYLLTFFDLKLLCNFSLVSKFCYNFAVDDVLWKPLFKREWGDRRGGGAVKRKKRIEPSKGKWRKRYLQLFLNKKNAEKDKLRGDMRMLIYYSKTFNLNMRKARQANGSQHR